MSKRPILIITISYLIGILIGLYLEINIAFFMYIIIIMISIFLAKVTKNLNKKNLLILIISLITMIISNMLIFIKENRFNNLYSEINENTRFVGVVTDVQKDNEYYFNYIVKINNVNGNEKFKNTNIIVKIKKNKNKNNTNIQNNNSENNQNNQNDKNKTNNNSELKCGDLIYGFGNFEKPSIRRNYKGFDYSQYLKTKNVYMICKTEKNQLIVLKHNSLFVGKMWIINLQNKLKNNLNILLPNDTKGLANALLLGDSNFIDNEQKEIFSNANLMHILAISGMHITYIITFLNLIMKKCDNRKSKYFIIAFLIFFSQLIGGEPSVIRAVIMSCLILISKLFYRKSDTVNNIAISCLFILLKNPYNILKLGFQLSFLGTLGIVIFNKKFSDIISKYEYIKNSKKSNKIRNSKKSNKIRNSKKLNEISNTKKLNKIKKKIVEIILLSISANLVIAPVLAYNYNTISLIFLISNLLVTPILGIMSLLGYTTIISSLFSLKLSKLISIPFNWCLKIFNIIAKLSSKISFLKLTITTPTIISIIIYYFVILYIIFFYKKTHNQILKKVLTICMIIVLIIKFIPNTSKLKIYFIDVGQGDSTLIITESNKKILIDGGGSENSNYDIGKNILVPYLLDRKIKYIDYMIFTHFDSDHCKGLFTVINTLKVKNAIISKQGKDSENYQTFLNLANKKNINIITVSARKQNLF